MATAIDRDYEALIRSGTWTYATATTNMNPVPLKCTDGVKRVDGDGNNIFYKEERILRKENQETYDDCDPDNL